MDGFKKRLINILLDNSRAKKKKTHIPKIYIQKYWNKEGEKLMPLENIYNKITVIKNIKKCPYVSGVTLYILYIIVVCIIIIYSFKILHHYKYSLPKYNEDLYNRKIVIILIIIISI